MSLYRYGYISEYFSKIESGAIVAGYYITEWYRYLIDSLEKGEFFYNDKLASRPIKFIETFCHHSKELSGLIKLELWQKAFISSVFGIVDAEGKREFNEVFLEVARKNGKTTLLAGVACFMLFADKSYGKDIYFTAPKLKQAKEAFGYFQQMIEREPELKALTHKIRDTYKLESTNSFAEPLAYSDKTSDGLNISLCVADEVASWVGIKGIDFYEVIKSSFGARREPLALCISTAGKFTDTVYDGLRERAMKIIRRESPEKKFAPFLYEIDDAQKWDDIEELKKSNPNMGVSCQPSFFENEINTAKAAPEKKAEFLRKYCNVKTNEFTSFLPTQTVLKCVSDKLLTFEDFRDCYAVGGVDLSKSGDLTSACLLIRKKGIDYVISKYWLPEARYEEARVRDGVHYEKYIDSGILELTPGHIINFHRIFDFFKEAYAEYGISPVVIGYDRAMADYLVQELDSYGFKTDYVQQWFNMSPSLKNMRNHMEDGLVDIGSNELLEIHLLNAQVKTNEEDGKIRLVKPHAANHIDGCMALSDAYVVRDKWGGEYSSYLENKEEGEEDATD